MGTQEENRSMGGGEGGIIQLTWNLELGAKGIIPM
jgi:hypothetical protein